MFVEYWQFITRELPPRESPTGVEAVPDFYYKTVMWTILFSLLHVLIPFLSKLLYLKWHKTLTVREQREFPSYLVCSLHHFAMVPTAWYHIYQDFFLSSDAVALVDYAAIESVVAPFCLGYLISDTICFAVQEAISMRFEMLIHHALVSWLVVTAMYGPGNLCRYIPHLLICDTTNIFFNSAWLLRRFGWKNTYVVSGLEILFAIAFFFVRVCNLPSVLLIVLLNPRSETWGYTRYTLIPISLMQWYWFAKIASTLGKRMSTSKKSTTTSTTSTSRNGSGKNVEGLLRSSGSSNNNLPAAAAVSSSLAGNSSRIHPRKVAGKHV